MKWVVGGGLIDAVSEVLRVAFIWSHYGVDATVGELALPPFRLRLYSTTSIQFRGSGGCGYPVVRGEVGDDFIAAAADCEHLCPPFSSCIAERFEYRCWARMRARTEWNLSWKD